MNIIEALKKSEKGIKNGERWFYREDNWLLTLSPVELFSNNWEPIFFEKKEMVNITKAEYDFFVVNGSLIITREEKLIFDVGSNVVLRQLVNLSYLEAVLISEKVFYSSETQLWYSYKFVNKIDKPKPFHSNCRCVMKPLRNYSVTYLEYQRFLSDFSINLDVDENDFTCSLGEVVQINPRGNDISSGVSGVVISKWETFGVSTNHRYITVKRVYKEE
jgi:hypothetical protein